MTLAALHIWLSTSPPKIERTLHDGGDFAQVKRVERYNKDQGLTHLYRVVVVEGQPPRVVPPGEEA